MKTLFTLFILLAQLTMAQSRTDGFAQGTRGLPYGMPYSMYTNLVLLMPNWEDPSNAVPWQVIDRSPAGNNGTQTIPASRPVWTNAVGGALVFDGTDDRVDFPTNNLNTVFNGPDKKWAVSFYYNISTLSTNNEIIRNYFRSWVYGIGTTAIGHVGNQRILFIQDDAIKQAELFVDSVFPTGSWVNVTMTYDGTVDSSPTNRVSIYHNGVKKNTTIGLLSGWPFDLNGSGSDLLLYLFPNKSSSFGILMVFNRDLTSNEVAYLYNLTKGAYGL